MADKEKTIVVGVEFLQRRTELFRIAIWTEQIESPRFELKLFFDDRRCLLASCDWRAENCIDVEIHSIHRFRRLLQLSNSLFDRLEFGKNKKS